MTVSLPRREFNHRLWLALGAGTALLLLITATAALAAAMLLPSGWHSLGQAAELRQARPVLVHVGAREFYLVWQNDTPLALSTLDPHDRFAGCDQPIRFDPAARRFSAPCGGATYQIDGTYLRGPSPRSMDRFATRIQHGRLEVDIGEIILGQDHL